jgi:hypothetical protein
MGQPGENYPHLFKKKQNEFPDPPEDLEKPPVDVLPAPLLGDKKIKISNFDETLSKKLGKDALLKIKAMDYTLEFLQHRPIAPEKIGEVYNIIYEKITNGTKQSKGKRLY